MAASRSNIAIEASRTGQRGHEQVEGAIPIDVSAGEAARHPSRATKGTVFQRNIAKTALPIIGEELIPFRIRDPKRGERRIGRDLVTPPHPTLSPSPRGRG